MPSFPVQVYNLHRSPYFWDRPNDFEPERFLSQRNNDNIEGWSGFDPSRSPGALYPNEVNIYLPFFDVVACRMFCFDNILLIRHPRIL